MALNKRRSFACGCAVAFALLSCVGAGAETLNGICTEAIDADTLIITINGTPRTVHLFGIDAPEPNQPYGPEATEVMGRFVGNAVEVQVVSTDDDEIVAKVVAGARDLSLVLTDQGFAWIIEEGPTEDRYAVSIFTARHQKLGLWAEPEPIHPFRWRRMHPIIVETKTRGLADVAAAVDLKKDEQGRVIIDATDIPSRFARYAEGELFIDRMIAAAQVSEWIDEADRVWQTYCNDSQPGGGESSVWSEELGAWVNGTRAPRGCRELSTQITEAERWVHNTKDVAIEDASRGGITQSDIKSVSQALDLEDH